MEGARERGLTVLGPSDPAKRAPTTAIACPQSHAVEVALREQRIIASARGPAIRLAPHFYSTEDDVDRALDALASAMATIG
jgi:selenocysteine lyase/cysteine desulfurase